MRFETVLSCLALCMLAACASPASEPPVGAAAGKPPSASAPHSGRQARGISWRLEDLDQTGIIDRSRITLLLGDDGRASGMAGCNRYTAAYTLDGTTLAVDPRIASTRMACVSEAMMYQEQRYFELLPLMDTAGVDATGALILTGKGGASMKFYPDEDAAQAP